MDNIKAKCSGLDKDPFVLGAICHQNTFIKVIPPKELKNWDKDELELFTLKFDSIDRVYLNQQFESIYGDGYDEDEDDDDDDDDGDDDYDDDDDRVIIKTDSLELYVRAKYKDKHIFVGLCCKVCKNGNHTSITGILSLTFDVEIFSKSMVKFYFLPDTVYKSLIKDGYRYVYIFG